MCMLDDCVALPVSDHTHALRHARVCMVARCWRVCEQGVSEQC